MWLVQLAREISACFQRAIVVPNGLLGRHMQNDVKGGIREKNGNSSPNTAHNLGSTRRRGRQFHSQILTFRKTFMRFQTSGRSEGAVYSKRRLRRRWNPPRNCEKLLLTFPFFQLALLAPLALEWRPTGILTRSRGRTGFASSNAASSSTSESSRCGLL